LTVNRYDWPFLITTVSVGYIGWIFVVAIFVVEHYTARIITSVAFSKRVPPNRRPRSCSFLLVLIPAAIGVLISVFLVLQQAPFMYYLYVAFPVGFLAWILQHIKVFMQAINRPWQNLWPILYAILAMEGLVIVYYYRFVFSLGFLFLATWPLRYIARAGRDNQLSGYWCASCLAVAIFPLLPAQYGDSPLLVYVCFAAH
jgi:phosphatidylinositol glycan class N